MAAALDSLKELNDRVQGEIRLAEEDRAMYAVDASNYRRVPLGIVIPRNEEDILQTLKFCREKGVPVLSRGGGTSLAGQTCNEAVILDTSKYMNRILEIDAENQVAWVEPGVVLDELNEAVRPYGLIVGPDPATHSQCTIGGMVGNNACGIHAEMSGRMEFNVVGMEVVTYRGTRLKLGSTDPAQLAKIIRSEGEEAEIYKKLKSLIDHYKFHVKTSVPDIPRRVSGFNLEALLPERGFDVAQALVGTEGTCVVMLKIGVKLLKRPRQRSLVVLGYEQVERAGDHIPEIREYGPIGLEGIDEELIRYIKEKKIHQQALEELPKGHSWLVVEFGGDSLEEAQHKAESLAERFEEYGATSVDLFLKPEDQEKIWNLREAALAATAHVPSEKETWPGWEDAAVPPENVGNYLRAFKKLMKKYNYAASLYGHFGQGCIHCRINFELKTQEGVENYRKFVQEAAELVTRYGGSLSGEHGDGQARGELLSVMYPEALMQSFVQFKKIWDPDWKMNPGKILKPDKITENLRIGTTYNPPHFKTRFAFQQDEGSLAKASLRCVGVGKCRKTATGIMCPSYMVTRDEKHSTRGRAHLFYEMLKGDPMKGGWSAEGLKDALDLCYACKACKSECPVNVDMATYKAEFLYHYYKKKLRPRTAYVMGLIFYWLRIGEWVPRLANFVTQTPGLRRLAKAIGGIAPARRIPKIALRSFKRGTKKFKSSNEQGEKVLLWADTFNNSFYPEILKSALNVLERQGFQVEIAPHGLCCGRPLYDFGFLDLAEKKLRQCVEALREDIRQGVPIVGLEPSCVAVFRDELMEMLPEDMDALRLSRQFYTLGEFLKKKGMDLQALEKGQKVMYHPHCHHESIMGTDSDIEVMKNAGLQVQKLDAGCCGMAGAFGFEKKHYEYSKKSAERKLIGDIRQADSHTHIVADGFSCREQIHQFTGQKPLHSAQVIEKSTVKV